MLLTDLPYLEPLWKWLRDDEVLKKHFTEHSFFMPHANLIQATEEAIKSDCPAPRALWILPQDTLASAKKEGCKSPGVHTFYIEIIVQCIRDAFQVVKRDDQIKLEGQFMELAELRREVKRSVLEFSQDHLKKGGKSFANLYWNKDQMLYPSEQNNFLATAIEFQVTIY